MGWPDDYWDECIAIAFEEAGIKATEAQMQEVAGAVAGGHENYGMASGDDVATSNWHAANERSMQELRDEVLLERAKVLCRQCRGSGTIVERFGTFQSESSCVRCRGDGRHSP